MLVVQHTIVGDKHVWHFGAVLLSFGDDIWDFVEVPTHKNLVSGTFTLT
jgi:hypothetical protein